MLTEFKTELAEERAERRRLADNPAETENMSRWVKEIGWAEHFNGADRKDVHGAGLILRAVNARREQEQLSDHYVPGGEDDKQLTRMGKSFERMIERCTRRMKLVPHETLRWLNSVDPSKPAGRPFMLKQHEESMYRYR